MPKENPMTDSNGLLTGAGVAKARETLGEMWGLDRPLRASELGRLLKLTGRDVGQTVLNWETGRRGIHGPESVAIEMMLDGAKPRTFQAEAARWEATSEPPPPPPKVKARKGKAKGRTTR